MMAWSKRESIRQCVDYFKSKGIILHRLVEGQGPVSYESIDCIAFVYPAEQVIGKEIQITLRFRENCVYLLSFPQPLSLQQEQKGHLLEIINYINWKVEYAYIPAFDHKLVYEEETKEVINAVRIDYAQLAQNFASSMNFITECQVKFWSDICYPLVLAITGDTVDDAKHYIDVNIMGE